MMSEENKNLEKAKCHLGLAWELFQENAMRENMKKFGTGKLLLISLNWGLGLNFSMSGNRNVEILGMGSKLSA